MRGEHSTPRTELGRSPDLLAFYPHPKFPALSITGDACALGCKHCGRSFLGGMIPCVTPDALTRRCLELSSKGAVGVLLSGGCNEEGYVPFEPFLDAVERVKLQTELFISAHTGLVPEWLAREMGSAGVDLADFDLVGSDETIRYVLGMDKTVGDYRRSMKALKRFVPNVVPHICVGLHAGKLLGEFEALECASEIKPSLVVMLMFTPVLGTEFGELASPTPENLRDVAIQARLRVPDAELALGCVRPRGSARFATELTALRSGIDRIELPSGATLDAAQAMGLNVTKLGACCAIPNIIVRRLSDAARGQVAE